MTQNTLPTTDKVDRIVARLRGHMFGDSLKWDRVEVEDISKGDRPLFRISAVRHEGTLAQTTLNAYHTGTRFAGAYSDTFGSHVEYKTLREFRIHELAQY